MNQLKLLGIGLTAQKQTRERSHAELCWWNISSSQAVIASEYGGKGVSFPTQS